MRGTTPYVRDEQESRQLQWGGWENMVTTFQDGLLSLLELFWQTVINTHTSSEINTIMLKGFYVQTFVLIEETVLWGLQLAWSKLFPAGGAESLLSVQPGAQRFSESVRPVLKCCQRHCRTRRSKQKSTGKFVGRTAVATPREGPRTAIPRKPQLETLTSYW